MTFATFLTPLPWNDMFAAALIPLAWLATLAGIGGWHNRRDEDGTGLPWARLFLALSLSAGMTWQTWPTALKLVGVLIWAGSTMAFLIALPFAVPSRSAINTSLKDSLMAGLMAPRPPKTDTDTFFEYLEAFSGAAALVAGIGAAVLVAIGKPWITASFIATVMGMLGAIVFSWLRIGHDKARAVRMSQTS